MLTHLFLILSVSLWLAGVVSLPWYVVQRRRLRHAQIAEFERGVMLFRQTVDAEPARPRVPGQAGQTAHGYWHWANEMLIDLGGYREAVLGLPAVVLIIALQWRGYRKQQRVSKRIVGELVQKWVLAS